MARSSRDILGSTRRVSSGLVSTFDATAIESIGWSVSLNFEITGSSISSGKSDRFSEILSRISCDASAISFPKLNSVMMLAKPSDDCDVTFLTPLIPLMASSIGSVISRSTLSGDAPG